MVEIMGYERSQLPDPVSGAPSGERRRSVRQKLHTPVYASFNGPQTGMVVDLSELLDLNQEGFAVQTGEKLEKNRAVTLCLDLPETKSFIHANGEVVWSDDAGRGGIHFSALPENSQKILKEWLFANLLIACSNYSARTEQLAHREEEPATPEVTTEARAVNVIPITSTNYSPAPLETVRRDIRELVENGDDGDAVLRFVADRVLDLMGASGAALALLADDRMIVRARSGDPAPPLGAAVDVKQGLSGECVRTGLIVSCEDLGNDRRVDPEIGRALGIGSFMAAPIVSDFRVVGLLEIFSPYPRRFTTPHGMVLERLVEMIPKALRGRRQPEKTEEEAPVKLEAVAVHAVVESPPHPVLALASMESDSVKLDSLSAVRESLREGEPEAGEQASTQDSPEVVSGDILELIPESASSAPSSLLHRALLFLVIAVVFVVIGYLVAPQIEKRWAPSPQAARRSASRQNAVNRAASAKSLPELQEIADHGDADAQWQLGLRFHDGEGVPRDDTLAVQWYLRAAEQGNVAAQGALGSYYWAGRGVPVDLSKSYFWSTIAMAQGDEISKGRLEGLASQMTHEQVSVALQQAEAWIRTHSERTKSNAN
jgi:hypothetical protein